MTTSMTKRAAGTLNPTRQQLDELDALLQRMLELPVHPQEKAEQAETEEPAEEPEPPPPPRKVESVKRKEEKPASVASHNTFRLPAAATPPISYTVVETASPRPLPQASGFEPRPSMLAPKLVPVSPPPQEPPVSPPPVAEADEEEMWVPLRSTWQPSASTWPPLAESWHQANGGTPSPATPSPIVDSRPTATPPLDAELTLPVEKPVSMPVRETKLETPNTEVPTQSEPQPRLSSEDAPAAVSWPLLPLVWFNQGFDACVAPLGAPGRWLCGPGRVVLGFIGLACLAGAAAIVANAGMAWSR